METEQLLKLIRHTLCQVKAPLTNIVGMTKLKPPFNWRFSLHDLLEEVDRHIKAERGFTVILHYPDDPLQTYMGLSDEDTWDKAVIDVAAQMLSKGLVDREDVIPICDVLTGNTRTANSCDRGAVVLFDSYGGPYVNVPS